MSTSTPPYEHVVLVDEANNVLGIEEKRKAHHSNTPLHRAFSLFLFHRDTHNVLIHQRALSKKTWPGVWSNSCCGHPQLNEPTEDAIRRRTSFELGINHLDSLTFASPYRYRYERDGIVENEICPIYIGITSQDASPHPEEIETYQWLSWENFLSILHEQSTDFSEWCREETFILQKTDAFQNLYQYDIKA